MTEEVTSIARQPRRAELRSANLAEWQTGGIDSDGRSSCIHRMQGFCI